MRRLRQRSDCGRGEVVSVGVGRYVRWEMNRDGQASGFVRVVELKGGSAFYAQLRLATVGGSSGSSDGSGQSGAGRRRVSDPGPGRGAAAGDPQRQGRERADQAEARLGGHLRDGRGRVDALRRARPQAAAVDGPGLPARAGAAADPGVRRGHAADRDHHRAHRGVPRADGRGGQAERRGRSTSACSSCTRSSSEPSAPSGSRSTRSPTPSASRSSGAATSGR